MYEPIFHYLDKNNNVIMSDKEYEKEIRKISENAFQKGRIQGLIDALVMMQEAPLNKKEEILKKAIKEQGEKGNETTEENGRI